MSANIEEYQDVVSGREPICRFCQSPATARVTQFKNLPCPLVHCHTCDGVFASRLYGDDELAEVYRSLYQRGTSANYGRHLDEFERVRMGAQPRLGWNKKCFFHVARRDLRGARILELGAGAGVFGLECVRRGAAWQGYDLSSTIVAKVRTETSLPIALGTWADAMRDWSAGHFDYIVGWEVFEHVQDIRQALPALRTLLAPGGKLVFSVPNYLRYTYGKPGHLGQDTPPIHVNFWSPLAIRNFLTVCGYRVELVRVKPYRDGGMRHLVRSAVEVALSLVGRFNGPTMVAVATVDPATKKIAPPRS